MHLHATVRKNQYQDSVRLMQISRQAASLPGVVKVLALLGTDSNKKILNDLGLMDDTVSAATPNDLVICVEAESDEAVGRVFNVGSQQEITILELARTVLKAVTATDDRIEFVPYDQAYAEGFEDMRRRVPNISRIQQYTGWAPRRSLAAIIDDVVADLS